MIGINQKERAYIKYKPSLTYSAKIMSMVEKETTYTPSESVASLLKNKPSGILGEIENELDIAKMMQERIAKCLEDSNVNGVSIADYLKNKKDPDGDKELTRKFEKDNAMAINGTSQAECLPLLLDSEQELESLSNLLNSHFYNNEVNKEHLEIAEEKDEAKMETTLKKDMSLGFTEQEYGKLQKDDFVLEICHRRLNNCKNLTKQINELLCTTVNTLYNGNVDDIVHKYGEAEIDVLDSINAINKIGFRRTAALGEEDKNRGNKLNNPAIKESMQSLFVRIGELKAQSDKILEWASSIDTDYDQNAYTQIVADAFDQVEYIQAEYEKAALEMFKQIRLDELVKIDIVSSLKEKRAIRQKIALISAIIEEKQSETFNPERFIQDFGLRNPGTMCSK